MKDKKEFDTVQTLQCVVSPPVTRRIQISLRQVSGSAKYLSTQFQTSLILPENKKKKIQSLRKPSQYHAVS